jgi:membrane protein implicated in regulation of membrane protease activity
LTRPREALSVGISIAIYGLIALLAALLLAGITLLILWMIAWVVPTYLAATWPVMIAFPISLVATSAIRRRSKPWPASEDQMDERS